jgi:hypothetical protein
MNRRCCSRRFQTATIDWQSISMATQWYWQEQEAVHGPVSFQELVGMVRDRLLDEDDLVRPHYSPEWQTTDTVVGLYPMAQRTPVPRQSLPASDAILAADDAATKSTKLPGKTYRLDEVTHDRDGSPLTPAGIAPGGSGDPLVDILAAAPDLDALESGEDSVNADEFVASCGSGGGFDGSQGSAAWDSIVQAAVEHLDDRESAASKEKSRLGQIGRIASLYANVTHPLIMRQVFRLMIAIVCCIGFGYWAVEYSNYEMSRFPSRAAVQQELKFFPLVGTCDVTDYWALLSLSAVVLGAVAYRGAVELESRWLQFD